MPTFWPWCVCAEKVYGGIEFFISASLLHSSLNTLFIDKSVPLSFGTFPVKQKPFSKMLSTEQSVLDLDL